MVRKKDIIFSWNNVERYLFSWEEIPGNDNAKLIKFLKKRFCIEWAEVAKIEKIDNDKTIKISNENNFLLLKLNDEKSRVNLAINDGITDEFIARMENGKLNIYVGSIIDQNSLREFLRDDFKIEWAGNATIKKVNDKKILIEKDEKLSAQIELDQKAVLKLNGRSFDLIAQKDNGNLNIYRTEIEGIGKSPVPLYGIIAIAVYHILLSIFLLAGLVTFLSAIAEGHDLKILNVIFSKEANLVMVVAFSGALGGLVHSLRSFYKYVGNRKLIWSWFAMYILLPFVGTCMGFIFYLVVRAGFFSPQTPIEQTSPYGFAALAALVGLFSEQALLKLKDVSETLFTKGEVRKDDIASRPETNAAENGGEKNNE